MKPLLHFFHGALFAFDQGLHRTIGSVLNPAGKTKTDSFIPGIGAEENSLPSTMTWILFVSAMKKLLIIQIKARTLKAAGLFVERQHRSTDL